MNYNMLNNRFGREWLRWLGWGAVCGSASLACAVTFDLNKPGMLVAMMLGIVTWSVLCTGGVVSGTGVRILQSESWRRALWWGLRLRAGIALLAVVGFLLEHSGMGDNLVVFAVPDLWPGMVTMGLVGKVFGSNGGGVAGEFLRIYVTTLVQGAWVVGTLWGLTAVIRLLLGAGEKAFASRDGGSDAAPL